MVLLQVGEVVAEAGEVVAGADLEVVADAAVGADQPAPAFAAVGDVEAAGFGQGIPLVAQAQAQLQRGEHGAGIQPGTGAAAEAVFAVAHGDLGTDAQVGVELVDAFQRQYVAALVVQRSAGVAADLAAAGQVVQVGVLAEGRVAGVVVRAPGEAEVEFGQAGVVVRAQAVAGAGVVGARGDAPVVVQAPGQAVGADPLLALLGAGVLAALDLAGPLHARIGAAAGQAHRAAVDLAAVAVELRVHQGRAQPSRLRPARTSPPPGPRPPAVPPAWPPTVAGTRCTTPCAAPLR